MKNSLVATVEFSFKGQTLSPSAEIDLDTLMERQGSIPSLYLMIANANNIGAYSYELEVMESEEIHYSQAQGLAVDYIHGGRFDQAGFEAAWHEHKIVATLQAIASEHLQVDDLSGEAALRQALLAAYRAGQATVSGKA